MEPLNAGNITRAAQLLNKTNQMNLATRRMGDAELLGWSRSESRAVLALTVEDKFGVAGLTGILSLESIDERCDVVDFVLSCRVMGRRIEQVMLYVALQWARARALRAVRLQYQPTTKNSPCHELLLSSTLARNAELTLFTWDCAEGFPKPSGIQLTWLGGPPAPIAE